MRLAALLALACAAWVHAQPPPVPPQRSPIEEAWELLAQGARGEALGLLRKIVQRDPRDADARLMLGSILAEDGEHDQAIAQLTEAVRLRPSAEAHNALGEAYAGQGDAGAARAQFEKAIAADSSLVPAYVSLALIHLEAGEFPLAASRLDRALAIMDDDEEAAFPHYLRAKVYTEANEIEKAAAELRKAVSLRPDFGEAWSDLGQARKTLFDEAGALAAFERSVQEDPENAVAQYRLGSEYLGQGKVKPAVRHLEAAFRLDPEDQSTLYNLQLALRQDGQTERAKLIKDKLAELLRARDREHQNAMVAVKLNNEGAAIEKTGDLKAALEKYRAAVALDPEHVGIRTNLAAALLRLGQWGPGIAELREALRRDPSNAALKQALEAALAQAPPGQRD
ncbi:MAG: tetratricopeptide repeat protein [Bryobacteraceae bacterium]|nr:tetratricopeptide repeat protein [Bryobacteraceae bacterium]